MRRQWFTILLCSFLCFPTLAVPASQANKVNGLAQLGFTQLESFNSRLLRGSSPDGANVASGDYSLAPLVQDADTAYFMTDAGGPTLHSFDGLEESAGGNQLGSDGGLFVVLEGSVPLGQGLERVIVEVTAVNSEGQAEPWVDVSNAGAGFENWRLDVGTNSGGTAAIVPGVPFTRVESGFSVFSSAGAIKGEFALSADTSTATSLSGVAVLSNSGSDIAGVDISSIQMYWDIQTNPVDLALQTVDAADGAYLPGNPIEVFVYIENVDAAPSASAFLDLYASADENITVDDRLLDSLVVPPLEVGGFFAGAAPTSIPADLANGPYYIGGILDAHDPDLGNNINHDANPIRVSTDPDIGVRPGSLDFVEDATAGLMTKRSGRTTIARQETTQKILPQLMHSARSKGRVRVLVGFDSPFQPEGQLTASAKNRQRDEIHSRGGQLLISLAGLNYKENRRFRFIPYLALSVDIQALEHLANSPLVTSIEEDSRSVPILASSNNVIGSPLAWAEGYDGTGQTVAVLDTGVDKTHSWFTTGGSRVISEACYSSTTEDTVSLCPGGVASSTAPGSGMHCDLSIYDCDHGTHVAGIVAGHDGAGPDFGVARGADIIAIQVFSRVDDPDSCEDVPAPCVTAFDSDLISALEHVYDLATTRNSADTHQKSEDTHQQKSEDTHQQKSEDTHQKSEDTHQKSEDTHQNLEDTHQIAAVNISLGGGQFFDQSSCDAANGASKDAIDQLRSINIATVMASGNDGWKDSIVSPACISSGISVGNTSDSDAIAPSSNIYPQIHLLAPGTSISSSVPGGGVAIFSGTSMSAPHVAGVWAVLKQANPGATVDEILAHLQNTGTPVDDLREGGVEMGMPRINLDVALDRSGTVFAVLNSGPAVLSVTSILPESAAPWIRISPAGPFELAAGGLQLIQVTVDYAVAPASASQTRLLIHSNDPDESPWPDGIFINVTRLDIIHADGFEQHSIVPE